MKIDRIEIRRIFLPYVKPFTTSGRTENGNNGIIIGVDMAGVTGWGEVPVSNEPYYIEETTGTAWSVIKEVLIPNLTDNYLKEGYKRVKIKIKPGWDLEPVREIRKNWKDSLLQVDANSVYKLADAEHLSELDEYNLLLIEQPLSYDDLYEHSVLQEKLKTPICLDESITSPGQATSAVAMKACRIINIKPSRVGGLIAAMEIHNIAQKNNIPVWCGGMLETGIGRYFKKDIVLNPFELNPDGTLNISNEPGCGAVIDEKFLEKITLEKLAFNQNQF
ncbi:MAG: enolase C-terminal domain-like protein [Ignavibacteriaceae bacterium]